jgi:hypothetical protein
MKSIRKNENHILFVCLFSVLTACTNQPLPEDAVVASDYSHISTADGRTWDVTFEYAKNSTFSGVVRHASQWHDSSLPFMTHDILVTTEDFALPEIVRTSVFNHKFSYHYDNDVPNGTINLLHVLPASPAIFEELQQIKEWQQVTISGREILKIDLFDSAGESLGFFMDFGCNSILVTSVGIKE